VAHRQLRPTRRHEFVVPHSRDGYREREPGDRGSQRDPRRKLVRARCAKGQTRAQERGDHADRDRDRHGDGCRGEARVPTHKDGDEGKRGDPDVLPGRAGPVGGAPEPTLRLALSARTVVIGAAAPTRGS